ncbi:MAG: hypothetical protein JWP97_3895 [Labilithrix sp.]|nr:hypothetical protein [Labilithrix sp.]
MRTRSFVPGVLVPLVVAGCLLASTSAHAVEPWSDADPGALPSRLSIGDSLAGFRGGLEYRANAALVRPLDLQGTQSRHFSSIEHRLRLDGAIDWDDKIRVTSSVDVLDGVLWGDNGSLGTDPEPTTGANLSTKNPNFATTCIQQRPGSPPTESSSYQLGLCGADPVFVRRLYGDVVTPIGLFRIGRQAFTEGASIAVNDGDGRKNRFGFARRGNSVDRVLFATKPLEGFKPKDERDKREDRGLFLILAYDRLVTDDPLQFSDDLHGTVEALRYLAPTHRWGRDTELRLFHSYRFSSDNGTGVNAFGGRAMTTFDTRIGALSAGFEGTVLAGSTREVSEAFRLITNDPAVSQAITQVGARAVVKLDRPKWTGYLEFDYASGDSDPQTRTPLTQFRFAEDTNVGLLMFKHVLAYQSARAAAAGVALLQNLGAPSYPVDEIASKGAFTNAFAIFPQFDFRPVDTLLFRAGVLMAWAPAKVVDPIVSLQRKDGIDITDDLVNFAGGKPNRYYGTELDGRIQWRFMDHFAADLEGAILFPGAALEDANGDAARSFLLQGRGTFFF